MRLSTARVQECGSTGARVIEQRGNDGLQVASVGTIDVIRRDIIGMDLGRIVREGSIIRADSRDHF